MASFVYNVAKKRLLDGDLDLGADTIKIMLVGSGYTPSPDDATLATAAAGEVSGTGYASGPGGTGRLTLANKTVTQDNTNDLAKFDADDPSSPAWTAVDVTGSIIGMVIYEHVSGSDDSLNFPIAYIDDGGFPIPDPAGNIGIVFAANGILRLF